MPWKVLGQKWHFLAQGLSAGQDRRLERRSCWKSCASCCRTPRRGGQFLWNNQQLVHFMVPQQREPWATIQTKKPHALLLHLTGPKGQFRPRPRCWSSAPTATSTTPAPDRDIVRLQFVEEQHLHRGDLEKFLREHLGVAQRQMTNDQDQ